ncbi:hypothetical protein Aph01nite_45820 [Acrocarpospora phusangensis]|uniref:Uncharacterized protein n=1 Tax=Acrocarpospora phusangensis TaxID=1070424 RepID=A0A919QC95_9ACTN|nr:hypothetical protein Aph01nite_45820 [Acrocarpospora phusangensis]
MSVPFDIAVLQATLDRITERVGSYARFDAPTGGASSGVPPDQLRDLCDERVSRPAPAHSSPCSIRLCRRCGDDQKGNGAMLGMPPLQSER